MTTRFKRRILLRGLGGAAVTAPFLGSLGGRAAKAETETPPKRLVVMFTHYGCITNRFFPTKSHGPLTAEDLAPTTLKHLAPFVDKLLMPRGIRAMNEWGASMERGQGNDPHTQVLGSYFTCQPVTPNSNDPFSFKRETKFDAKPIGPSLDHVLAQQLSPKGSPLFMRVGNRTDVPSTGISYSASETPYDGLGLPAQAFSELTGLFQDGSPLSPDSYQALRGQSILDLVKDDLETLERFEMSQADRKKLEAWKELLHQTGTVVASAQCNEAVATELGATLSNVNAVPTAGDVLGSTISGSLDGADIYSSVAALAAVCNANPVIFLKYPASYVFSSLGISYDSHALSMRIGNANMAGGCLTDVIEMLLTIDDYYSRKFAHLVGLLDGIDEGDGTVLDNCAAVWFQEMSDGNAHNLNNLPIVQLGSAGGYFKTGWAVNVADESASLPVGNSEASCPVDPMDLTGPVPTTGTDAAFANAPINKYYVSLMNALGVRAGEDGFPSPQGQAEVSRFGRYDRTEDFVGGDVNPPMIHSPGGFDALKA